MYRKCLALFWHSKHSVQSFLLSCLFKQTVSLVKFMSFFFSQVKYMPKLEIVNGNFPFKVLTLTLDLPYMHLLFHP